MNKFETKKDDSFFGKKKKEDIEGNRLEKR